MGHLVFPQQEGLDNKVVNNVVAMDWSAKFFAVWKVAKTNSVMALAGNSSGRVVSTPRWKPPTQGVVKLNTDAAIKP